MLSKVFLIKLITYYSALNGIDPRISISVAELESKMNPNAIGAAKEIGLFQLKPKYVTGYTREELFEPEINIKVGVERLAQIKRESKIKGKLSWLCEYNVGKTGARKIKHPELFPYVLKIQNNIAMMEK